MLGVEAQSEGHGNRALEHSFTPNRPTPPTAIVENLGTLLREQNDRYG